MRARLLAYALAALMGWTLAFIGLAAYLNGRSDDWLTFLIGFAALDAVLMTVAFLLSLLDEGASADA